MTETGPYHDPDRPPRGSPRTYGDLAGLGLVPTSELRHRMPSEWALRVMHRKLVIAACHDRRIAPRIVAESLGLSAVHVRKIYRLKAKAESGRAARPPAARPEDHPAPAQG